MVPTMFLNTSNAEADVAKSDQFQPNGHLGTPMRPSKFEGVMQGPTIYPAAELTALLRMSPVAIYATDLDGIVTMWSPAAERLSGFSHEDAVGRFLPIVPEDATDGDKERVRLVCAGERESSAVLTCRRKDGSMVEWSISTEPLIDEFGVPRGVISLAENLTEKITEHKTIERMQSELVSTVSHELRTPLTSISASLGLIASGTAGAINDRAARLIQIANNNAKRLIRLVNDILDIEKLESGQVAFQFAAVRIGDIVDQAVSSNLAYAATFDVELRRSGEESDAVVKADPDRLNQAITNLISNAVKFTPVGSEVVVYTGRTAESVRISVVDQGPGIPEEFRARIFERFAQADSSDNRQKGGSGLGLNIVREIVRRHGGLVSFESDLGIGTSFHLDLPVVDGEDHEPPRTISDLAEGRALALAYLAHRDPITGLANRTLLAERLVATIEETRERPDQIALFYVLLVDFSEINETLGTDDSDAVLKGVAARMSELANVDSNAIAAYLGGAQFALLRRGKTVANDAEAFADILMRSIAQPMLVGQEALMIEPSVGTASFMPNDLRDPSPVAAASELMKRAAIALSAAHRVGPGTHRFYDKDSDHRTHHRMKLRHSLRGAIDQDQFELHYQPLVDLRSGEIVSAEALIRWQHPQLGLLRPDLFISLAEESGLIAPLGDWVMRTAMRQFKAWESKGLNPPKIALNVSAVQLKMPDFVETVKKAVAETGADARRCELELTEGILLEHSPKILSTLTELSLLGFELVIDDFGAGHASFQYLRNLPIHKIKIDKIFVRQMVADSSDAIIIRAMATLARNLKIGLVAEGIETIEQRDFLRDQGCTTGQGYLFSLPLTAEDFAWIIQQKIVLPSLHGEEKKGAPAAHGGG